MAYQRKFWKLLKREAPINGWTFLSEPWIHYADASGPGYAAPDAILVRPGHVAVFEVKLTRVVSAIDELQLLYAPLCREIWSESSMRLIEVFHNPGNSDWGTGPRIEKVSDIPFITQPEYEVVSWHWLG